MTGSSYTSFALVGVGGLGGLVLDALLSKPKGTTKSPSIIVLTRPGSSDKRFPPGVTVVPVDYSDVRAVTAAFAKHEVEVVISTVGIQAVNAQYPLADAAKAAGVKLFSPSEYGFVTEGQPKDGTSTDQKTLFGEYLRSIGLPFTRIYTSLFTEGIPSMAAYDLDGKFHIIGKGETPGSYTSMGDAAGFVAHIMTTLPPSTLHNAEFRVEGDRASLKEVAALFKAPVEYVDKIPGEGSEFKTIVCKAFEIGYGSTGWDASSQRDREEWAGSGNRFWEGHSWKTIADIHNL